jgi:hypothetical protein
MNAFLVAIPLALLVALVLHLVLPAGRQLSPRDSANWEPRRVGISLLPALALVTVVLSFWRDQMPAPPPRGLGPALWPLVLAALPLAATTLASDFGRPSSERHALGVLLAGIALFAAGLSIQGLSNPVIRGTTAIGPVAQVIITIAWLFLLASIVELMSLVPGALTLVGVSLGTLVWILGGGGQTTASYTLAGIIVGALLGRAAGSLLRHEKLPMGKAEVFALGIWLTALSNLALLKSVAFAGFVLPLGALTIAVILVTLRAFERSLILRATPRSE